MKKRISRILAIALAGTMVAGLAACSSGNNNAAGGDTQGSAGGEAAATEASASDTTVGIVVKTASNAHFQDISYGAVLAGKDLGINVKVDNTSTESEVEEQVTKCENMISAGINALILTANDSDGVANAVNAAHDAGIPFVTVDTGITNVWGDDVKEYMPNYIGVNHEEMAYNLAKTVIEKAGGKGKVIVLRGVDAATSSNERTAGFERAIAEFPDVTYDKDKLSQSASYDQDTAVQVMSDLVQNNKDVKIVLCCNDLMAAGAVTALEENNLTAGEDGVLVAGIDGNLIALQSIKDGKIYASAYDWSILQGYDAVVQAYDLIQGKTVPETTTAPDTIITAENVDEYLPHGEELAAWTMGNPINEVSDYMRSFVEKGQALEAEAAK